MSLSQNVMDYRYGIRHNLAQFSHQLVQVFFVGLAIGMFRTVVPALAETEFGVAKGSFMMLMAFVTAFGFVKATLNFVAGRLSERIGRKKVLFLGWLAAVPIPFMILYAPSWGWIVAATVLLTLPWAHAEGKKHAAGLMTGPKPRYPANISDIAHPNWRGSAIGIYRFWRDLGYGIGALLLGAVAALFGGIEAGFWFTAAAMFVSGLIVLLACEETHPRLNPAVE